MATKTERLIEANRRGLLTGDKKARFDEAVSRGLIQLPPDQVESDQLETNLASPESMREFAERAQTTVQYPGAESGVEAFFGGAKRAMQSVGEGIYQRGLDVQEFFGGDTDKDRRDLEISRRIEKQKYKPTSEEYPVSSTVGEIAGSIAAVPVGTTCVYNT